MNAAAKLPVLRAARIELIGLGGATLGFAGIVVAEDMPELVMFDGEPLLHDPSIHPNAYRAVKPYRIDAGGF
jgi:hypothetical protein